MRTQLPVSAVFLAIGFGIGVVCLLQGSADATPSMENDGVLYVAHWTHTAENCPGRSKEGAKMLSDFYASREAAAQKGVKILGSYVTVTEHDYYIIFQAKDYAEAVKFFLPRVPTQTGAIRPVLPMAEWIKINQPK